MMDREDKLQIIKAANIIIGALRLVVDIVSHSPTIEAEPVKHGRWEKNDDEYYSLHIIKCSLCHEEWCFEIEEDVKDLNYHYCPHCGAKMDLEE